MKPPSAADLQGPTVGLLLAAGLGRRFDPSGQSDKLMALMPDGKPVLWHSARALKAVLRNCLAVIQPGQSARQTLLESLGYAVLLSHKAENGMGASLAAGIEHIQNHTPHAQAAVIALGDMPWLRAAAVQAVVDELNKSAVNQSAGPTATVAPWYDGQRGHPVGFRQDWFAALSQLTGDQGAKELMRKAPHAALPWSDASVLRDVDLPSNLDAV